MNLLVFFIVVVLVIFLLAIVLLLAYSLSPNYTQTLTVTLPFKETYRYVANGEYDDLDEIKIKIKLGASMKKQQTPIPKIKQLVTEYIIDYYANTVLVQEADIFDIPNNDSKLKRFPLLKPPSVENLSIIFFNKLAPILGNNSVKLLSVKITSNDVKAEHSRHQTI